MRTKANLEFFSLLEKFFTEYLPKTINASPHTIKSYKCAFRLLIQYLTGEVEIKISDITFETLDFNLLTNFFEWLSNTRNNSRMTRKQRIGALSSFADYAQHRNLEAGYTFWNSLSKLSKKSFRRVKCRQRCIFTRDELEILFSLPDTSSKIGFRDLVILVVMYASGARAQEICDLTVKDITYDSNGNAILQLMGKGAKLRRVKITSDATSLLCRYIAYRKIEAQQNRHIFSSQRNEHISVSCVEEIYAKYEKIAKSEHPDKFNGGSYTPHVMRHTTASHLIEAGVPVSVVKNILGHSSIQTTQIYVEVSQQTVDQSMKKWSDKWFPNDKTNEFDILNSNSFMPEFLI